LYLQKHWFTNDEKVEGWALAFRAGLPTHGHDTNNFSEGNTNCTKHHVFGGLKATNVYDAVLRLTGDYDAHFQKRLSQWLSKDNGLWVRALPCA